MTIFYFPQWQGSFRGNKLYGAAKMLRTHLETTFKEPSESFVDMEVESTSFSEYEGGIIERPAIIQQIQSARAVLDGEQPTQIYILGGDCGIEVVPITSLNARYSGDLAVIWFDAHGDLNTPETSPSQTFHGMPLRVILGEGEAEICQRINQALSPTQVFLVGVRELDQPEQVFIEQTHLWIMDRTSPLSNQNPLFSTIQARGYHNIYIHFDLDVLDPSAFPYIDYPTPNGLSIEEALSLVQSLAKAFNLVGMSITEYGSEIGEGLDSLEPLLRFFIDKSRAS